MLQNVIDENNFYIFYSFVLLPHIYKSATEHFDVLIFIQTLRIFFLVPIQVKTTITSHLSIGLEEILWVVGHQIM